MGLPKAEWHTYGHAKHASNSVRAGGKLSGGIPVFTSTDSAGGNGTDGTRADDA